MEKLEKAEEDLTNLQNDLQELEMLRERVGFLTQKNKELENKLKNVLRKSLSNSQWSTQISKQQVFVQDQTEQSMWQRLEQALQNSDSFDQPKSMVSECKSEFTLIHLGYDSIGWSRKEDQWS